MNKKYAVVLLLIFLLIPFAGCIEKIKEPFTGPQGVKGDRGERGERGEPGVAGKPGVNGKDGSSSYVYVAYATDVNGSGFTTVYNDAMNYMAIKTTSSPINSLKASDFAGLWFKFRGPKGDPGIPGIAGQKGPRGYSELDAILIALDVVIEDDETTEGARRLCIQLKEAICDLNESQLDDL